MKLKSNVLMFILLSCLLTPTLLLSIIQKKNLEPAITCDLITSETYYIAIGESLPIQGADTTLDQDVLYIDENMITGKSAGEIELSIECKTYKIVVSDLIEAPQIKEKEFLKCGTYTKQENEELDSILSFYINKAGYATRAGVVEAARFLTLRFPYKISYFYENGRISDDKDLTYADGEGRYYHKGLYLNEYKYDELDSNGIVNGPACWGCYLECEVDSEFENNGLDCSGFVSWALLNGGYDVGDLGAGPVKSTYDLSDLGKKKYIDEVKISELKVGDLLGFDKEIGHIGIIIGIDENNVYIAEEYWTNSLTVLTYTYDELINDSKWEYVMLMDSYYLNDGNLTNMW